MHPIFYILTIAAEGFCARLPWFDPIGHTVEILEVERLVKQGTLSKK